MAGEIAFNGTMELKTGETPVWVIQPSKGFLRINLPELWHYRELFYFLVWREIKVRYKQTFIGAGWAIIQPFFSMVIFTLFFGNLAKIPSDGIPYPVFSYAALLPWTFFAQAMSFSANSLIANSNLVTKIYFPRLIMPVAPVLACLVDLAIACALLFVLMPYYGVLPSRNLWAIPIPLFLAVMTACGIGIFLSALNVKYRDFRYVIPFLTQFWMFGSPVVYPASMVPEQWRIVYGLNPMTGVIEGFRWALLGTQIDPWSIILTSAISATVILFFGIYYFRRAERFFADLI